MNRINNIPRNGFTLVELLIVLGIISVLAAIAYPAYVQNSLKTKRAAAQADLLELASFMERNFTEANRYDQLSDGTALNTAALPFQNSPRTGTARYSYTVATPTTTTFTLTATPQNAQTQDSCGAMTITHTGAKTPTTGDCWK